MMEINSLGQQPTPNQSASPDVSGASRISSDFETFLKMLTTQMENQDPLNPIESADFAVQLATFSGVEQQVQTNDLLRSLADGLGASGISQLAGWVGMEARVVAPVYFDGAPVTLSPEVDPGSDEAYLIVRNEVGTVVSKEAMPRGQETVFWGGTDSTGTPLPFGRYTFELESLNSGNTTSTKPIAHYALVQEARIGSEGVDVVLPGDIRVQSKTVTALRDPNALGQ